jgi:hypothetical protein
MIMEIELLIYNLYFKLLVQMLAETVVRLKTENITFHLCMLAQALIS